MVSSRSALLDSFHENEYTSYDTHIRNEEIYHDLCAIDNCSSISISEVNNRFKLHFLIVNTNKKYGDCLHFTISLYRIVYNILFHFDLNLAPRNCTTDT